MEFTINYVIIRGTFAYIAFLKLLKEFDSLEYFLLIQSLNNS